MQHQVGGTSPVQSDPAGMSRAVEDHRWACVSEERIDLAAVGRIRFVRIQADEVGEAFFKEEVDEGAAESVVPPATKIGVSRLTPPPSRSRRVGNVP